jgi:hypothetical protein
MTLEEQLSTEDGVVRYVEAEFARELPRTPVIWCVKNCTEIQRLNRAASRWSWRRWERGMAWRISCAGGDAEIYYDIIVSRDLAAFILTHANSTAGCWDTRFLIRKATLIPFQVVLDKFGVYRSEPLTLGQLVSEALLDVHPNSDYPT